MTNILLFIKISPNYIPQYKFQFTTNDDQICNTFLTEFVVYNKYLRSVTLERQSNSQTYTVAIFDSASSST